MTAQQRADAFHALHQPGRPVVLFNVWDVGSAKAVVGAGAKAVATGSASVAGAFGYGDGEAVPLDLVLGNVARIVASLEEPVSLDFEGGYSADPHQVTSNFAQVLAVGVIGCNFEDQIIGGVGLHSSEVQVSRIRALRNAADEAAVNAFINARTDMFLKAHNTDHTAAMVDEAIERAKAYASAGANGFFIPGLIDDALIAKACEMSPLPVNIIAFPGVSAPARLAELGVARISHGPLPWRNSMRLLAEAATAAMA